MSTSSSDEWEQRYQSGEIPWDSGIVSKELVRVLQAEKIAPCRAAELGCGTGTNAIELASRGFDVTAFDFSPTALETARKNSEHAGKKVQFVEADLCHLKFDGPPFDFLFDRGCYHTIRRLDIAGFLRSLRLLSHPGTRYLLLAGNANERTEQGPPRVHEHEIRLDLEGLFEIHWIREFRFEVPDPPEGFLAWSCFMTRKA